MFKLFLCPRLHIIVWCSFHLQNNFCQRNKVCRKAFDIAKMRWKKKCSPIWQNYTHPKWFACWWIYTKNKYLFMEELECSPPRCHSSEQPIPNSVVKLAPSSSFETESCINYAYMGPVDGQYGFCRDQCRVCMNQYGACRWPIWGM